MKTCRHCQQDKDDSAYCVNRDTKDGLNVICRQCAADKHRAWRAANPAKLVKLQTAYAQRHPDRVAKQNKAWRDANKAHLAEYRAKRMECPLFRLKKRLVNRVRQSARDTKDVTRLVMGMDYTVAELRSHLERQFLPGMSWEKMHLWAIDHIVPLVDHDMTTEAGIMKAWALPNLRPMWSRDNKKKHAKRTHLL
jgi:hypothetical protein